METRESQLQQLFEKNEWTDEDHALFLQLLDGQTAADLSVLFQDQYLASLEAAPAADNSHARLLLRSIHERAGIPEVVPVRRISRWPRMVAAASILLLLMAGCYYWLIHKPATSVPVVTGQPKQDIKAPAANYATITLANGQQISLDSTSDGQLAIQGNVELVKLDNGKIAYQPGKGGSSDEVVYNTLTNPRGSKIIDMRLADGSHVWLNANSSVTYPVSFTGKERKVEMTGEAYFEVAHDAAKPFYVNASNMQVEVLGTHFNINAYSDEENISATLLEGKVKVAVVKPGAAQPLPSALLTPGRQAQLTGDEQLKVMQEVDVDEVMAWKKSRFQFNKATVPQVMRQIARWYNVDVKYEGAVPVGYFRGEISRDVPVSEALKILAVSGVNFKIYNNTIVILP